ncbi:MAG: hypothetical protein QX198_07755 [Methylococcaceae bacterium]
MTLIDMDVLSVEAYLSWFLKAGIIRVLLIRLVWYFLLRIALLAEVI